MRQLPSSPHFRLHYLLPSAVFVFVWFSVMLGSLVAAVLHRAQKQATDTRAAQLRVLCISVCADPPAQYVPVMNAIFCAHKLGVLVDVCVLADEDSPFLQQAAHISSGIYLHLRAERQPALLQYLLSVFLLDNEARQLVVVPQAQNVDLRAACFCCKPPKILSIGHVCSVCLSVFCDFRPVCPTCSARFPFARRK
eukprot:TRINITY_DN4648_c0_g1_i1.p3 TRINITY_DN4648_c0_g1~~TRINITY_DN4648_c0_g1_i1.p3  ORF type:complete len:195 (+),score=37.78 TRINITY_DN4648_c0_g1_i1:368-952(+)